MRNLRFETSNSHSRVECRRLAYVANGYPHGLHIADVCGPLSACQALAATLQSGLKSRILWEPEDQDYGGLRLQALDVGYKVYKHKLDAADWHFLIVSKEPQLLADASDSSLWKALTGPRFTTPMLREWVPSIRAELKAQGYLEGLDGEGLDAALLTCDSDQLDAIVSSGVIQQTLKIAC